MQQETIIILGAGVMQGPAIRIAKELGFFTVAVDGSSAAPCIAMADRFEQIDLKDKEGIEGFARSLQNSGGLGGIMTAGTDFSATVAWVAEKLGLPGIPYEAALNASDKARMRACFKKAGLPSPEFRIITEADLLALPPRRAQPPEGGLQSLGTADSSCAGTCYSNSSTPLNGAQVAVPSFLIPHSSFPLVIKPVDNMGGRGCCRVDSIEEFSGAAADALRFSRSGRAIVEAFMEGPEFSVDAIVYHGEITICGLADRHIFFPPYFIEMGHTMPTVIAAGQQQALLETFCAGVRALGLADGESIGAAKGDIKLCPKGPMIGEIAARLSGGYMSGWTYPYSSGVEPIRAAILAAMGRKPDNLTPLKTWTSAERAFISIPGTVKAITGTDAARGQPLVRDLFFRIAEGDKVSFPENNVSKCGNIISAAPDRASAVAASETAARSILIRLDPANPETAEFLALPLDGALDRTPRRVQPPKSGLPSLNTADFSGAGTGHIYPSTPLDGAPDRFPPSAFQLTPELQSAFAALPETLISHSSLLTPHSPLVAFPAFAASGLTDYMGRSVAETLAAVRELTGLLLQEIPAESVEYSDNKGSSPQVGSFLGKSFWAALARGGYQGAVYYIDQLRGEN